MEKSIIFSTDFGSVVQLDNKNKVLIKFEDYQIELNILCFFCLKRKVDNVKIPEKIHDLTSQGDWEIICTQGCDRCLVFTLTQLTRFKELLDGARVMMELNSIINERLRLPVLV